jgi:NTP pyrophosphatase (non-canonical NTP hydrolase)
MDFTSYCEELFRINAAHLSSFKKHNWFANILFGLTEETLELHCKMHSSADNATDLILELGDVLAYAVLIVGSLRKDSHTSLSSLAAEVSIIFSSIRETAQVADDFTTYVANDFTTYVEIPLKLAGDAKRWFRESKQVELTEIVKAFLESHLYLNTFLQSKMQLAPVSIEWVAQQNIQKLLGREQRNTLFVGAGDNR